MSELRPAPLRVLPAACLRSLGTPFKLDEGEIAAAGAVAIDDGLLALLPSPGRPDQFALAAALAESLRRQAQAAGAKFPGLLIFPGTVHEKRDGWQLESSPLQDDLHRRQLQAKGELLVTGYVAAWLRGRYELTPAGGLDGAGRQIPLWRVDRWLPTPRRPGRNFDVLGRQIEVESPELLTAIRCQLDQTGGVVLKGGLGVGKTFAAWQVARDEAHFLWIDLGRKLPGDVLAGKLAELSQVGDLADATLEGQVSWLLDGLAARAARGDWPSTPLIVIDDAHLLAPADAVLLARFVPSTIERGLARFLLVEAGGWPSPLPAGALPSVVVESWSPERMKQLADGIFARLEVPQPLRERWLEAAGGCPWALEEGLLSLVHQGLMRRVFGSYFYAGSRDAEYLPSARFVAGVVAATGSRARQVAAQLLAVAGEPIETLHLIETSAHFGADLPWGWEQPLLAADLLRPSPDGELEPFSGAVDAALAATLRRDGIASLRHALGGVLAESGGDSGLAAYRLLAGTPEALPSLLDFGRDSTDRGSREEVFNGLFKEYREHCERFGDIATELEILWVLLPLARRLGCLSRLERELDRAIELAADDSQRLVALIALRAEHDQDRGRARDAERGFRAALAASEGLEEGRRAILLTRLGALLHRQDRTSEAREIFESLLQVVDPDGRSPIGATCLFFLGNIALFERRLPAAADFHGRAAAIRRGRGGTALAASLSAQGAVALAQGDYMQALRYAEEAEKEVLHCDAGPEELGYAVLGRGRALARLGDPTGAVREFRRVVELRQGRDDVSGESIGRLELANGLLQLGRHQPALEEARRAHFYASLIGQGTFLGDAERLVGRALLLQGQTREAGEHLAEAVRLHHRLKDRVAETLDRCQCLQLALQQRQREETARQVAALERLLDEGAGSANEESACLWLYRGLSWLADQGFAVGDPVIYLRRAYQELMRKANYLEPSRRHGFLFQIAEHQAIVDAATERGLSLPILNGHAGRG